MKIGKLSYRQKNGPVVEVTEIECSPTELAELLLRSLKTLVILPLNESLVIGLVRVRYWIASVG